MPLKPFQAFGPAAEGGAMEGIREQQLRPSLHLSFHLSGCAICVPPAPVLCPHLAPFQTD